MPLEIERKFLVKDAGFLRGIAGIRYRQGYLCSGQGVTVRVRVGGGEAFVTIKGPPRGFTRDEFEYPIPPEDAEAIFPLCRQPIIEKTRYHVRFEGATWEVDVFDGANAGLIVAEIELPSETHAVAMPPWVASEVTGDHRYSNASLVDLPYCKWPKSSS